MPMPACLQAPHDINIAVCIATAQMRMPIWLETYFTLYYILRIMTDKTETNQKKSYNLGNHVPENTKLTAATSDAGIMTALQLNGIELPDIFTRDILLMHTMINGCMHVKNIHRIAKQLKAGDQVRLVLEPDNPADHWAILIRDKKDRKIGYIPRKKNEVLFHLMDAGKYLYGIVTDGDIGPDIDMHNTWIKIFIDVYMRD